MPTLLQRLKLRHKLAALSVVGVTMCLLPLWQVLRYQAIEIDSARNAEAGPDPARLTLTLQHGLIGHRDLTAQVLGGLGELEMERRLLQTTVTLGMAEVGHAVQRGGPLPAMEEVQSMRSDWVSLVQRVLQRRLSVEESNAAHRLLVEQTLQIIDLVADSSHLLTDRDPSIARLAQALAAPLPRLTVALQQPRKDLSAPRAAEALKSAAAAADRALLALPAATDQAQARALADSLVRARRAVALHLQHLHQPHEQQAAPVGTAPSLLLAQQAHLAVVAALQAQLQGRLADRVTVLQDQRQLLLLAMGLLALLALALAASVLRALASLDRLAAPADDAQAADGQSAMRDSVRWLWQRLGRSASAAPAADARREVDSDVKRGREGERREP